MTSNAWPMKRTHCPHCSSPRISRRGPQMLFCHDCKVPCSKHSTEKSVRNWQMVRMYEDEKLNTQTIADIFGINHGTVYTVLKNYGVQMRPRHHITPEAREKSIAARQHRTDNGQVTRGMELLKTD